MLKIKRFQYLLVFGLLTLLLFAGQAQADTTPIDNTGTGTANFNNNGYTPTTGFTMKTGKATSGGAALNKESNVGITINNANFQTYYTDASGFDGQGFANNQGTVNNLETGSGTSSKLIVDSNNAMINGAQAYTGGHIKVLGQLDLSASLSGGLSQGEILAGDYGVMVRITLPADSDASKMADAIEWDKAYFFMQLNVPIASGKATFPMQFDHHVYLDPDKGNVFYLKVKGIPITENTTNGLLSKTTTFALARSSSDYIDYKNNITDRNGGTTVEPAALGNLNGTNKTSTISTWPFSDPWYFLLGALPSVMGTVAQQGDIGWSYSLAYYGRNLISVTGPMSGKAYINFYVDLSKYKGNISDLSPNKQLTSGKIAPSPRQDGLYDIKISAYGTDQLVDPFSSSANKETPGKTPVDYALIDPNKLDAPQAGDGSGKGSTTSNITSWNAYASPWDTKKSLNATVTSAWESVGGDKTRLNNVSLTDTLTDRTVTLNTLTDGVMVTKGKGTDAAGTDYSGTTAPTLGAVGTSRFARVVNYFDTTKGDATTAATDKTTNTKAVLTTKAYTAATAGKAAPSTDAALTLPTLTTTANKSYLYYMGTSASSAGTAIPILGAPLFFNQTNTPAAPTINWNSDNVYYIKKSELASGKTVALKGTWADDYANADTINASDNKSSNTLNNFAKVEATDSKTFSLNITSGTSTSALNLGTDSTLLGLHTITATINRPTLKLANGETITSNAAAKATVNVYVVDDSVNYDVTAQKYISNNGNQLTQQYVHGPTASNDQTGDTVTMVDEFTNKGTAITTPIVVVPLAAQLKQVGTPTVTVDGKAVTAQVVPMSGYFNITWAGPIAKGSQVVVSYQVQATAALPTSGLTPTDVMMDQSSYVVDTNKVTLLPAATTGGIEITPPTNLEFGTHSTTPGLYKNTDGDKTLLVTDNRATPGPWTVTAQLSDFTAGSRKLTGEMAKINFGTPALSSAIFTAGGPANQLVSYDYADKQTSMSYVFKNIQLQLAGNNIQPGDYHATITYSWTDGVN